MGFIRAIFKDHASRLRLKCFITDSWQKRTTVTGRLSQWIGFDLRVFHGSPACTAMTASARRIFVFWLSAKFPLQLLQNLRNTLKNFLQAGRLVSLLGFGGQRLKLLWPHKALVWIQLTSVKLTCVLHTQVSLLTTRSKVNVANLDIFFGITHEQE